MFIRRFVLVLLFLLVQAGALAHGIGHFSKGHDHHHDGADHEPVCQLCLAFAPLGAGMAGATVDWSPPVAVPFADGSVPEFFLSRFQPTYRSRGPPRLTG